ncbi:hypothetical protein LTR85_008281 [Meristemomyces frigidus]|nr:hypothetical protein LTR85_008281 [Meristemomyces frigidus]
MSVLKKQGGLTLGDLHDAAAMLFKEHENCANAEWRLHNRNGTVRVTVHFRGTAKVQPKGPTMKRLRRETERTAKKRLQKSADNSSWRRKARAFVAAKHGAKEKGLHIPTFKEFEEAYQSSSESGSDS